MKLSKIKFKKPSKKTLKKAKKALQKELDNIDNMRKIDPDKLNRIINV